LTNPHPLTQAAQLILTERLLKNIPGAAGAVTLHSLFWRLSVLLLPAQALWLVVDKDWHLNLRLERFSMETSRSHNAAMTSRTRTNPGIDIKLQWSWYVHETNLLTDR